MVFSNGIAQEGSRITSHCPRAIAFLSHGEKWAYIVKNNFVGSMSPQEARQEMLFLKNLRNEKLKGLASSGDITREISFEDLIVFLQTEDLNWKPLEIIGSS